MAFNSYGLYKDEIINFKWACAPNLRYFKLVGSFDVPISTVHGIAGQLSTMPNLQKVKFKAVYAKTVNSFSSSLSSLIGGKPQE